MGKSNRSVKDGILKRIEKIFAVRQGSCYLEQHGYYDSFKDKKYSRSPESFPHLPYSLQDLLEDKDISGRNVMVAAHRSTALWLRRGKKNRVTLARLRRDGTTQGSGRLQYLESYRMYDGAPIDILVWDSHQVPGDLAEFITRSLSPQGVVIFVTSEYFDALENNLGVLCERLESLGMRQLVFRNPGPRREILTAVLCYPRENVLDI